MKPQATNSSSVLRQTTRWPIRRIQCGVSQSPAHAPVPAVPPNSPTSAACLCVTVARVKARRVPPFLNIKATRTSANTAWCSLENVPEMLPVTKSVPSNHPFVPQVELIPKRHVQHSRRVGFRTLSCLRQIALAEDRLFPLVWKRFWHGTRVAKAIGKTKRRPIMIEATANRQTTLAKPIVLNETTLCRGSRRLACNLR